ncbi:hypothetical protein [Pontibacter beigongshangensis]|uniref:hypothetical protein n=1 Tax=Pontibacter beigongshangensis TaxID=2574733 RepID=UPI0016505349|nr:hypothetical protein [Pontibacter beigongshangensis]
MKNILIILMLLTTVTLSSCDKEYGVFYSDNRPAVPVTYPGTTTHGFNPYITHSISGGGNITFTLSIPENSGRTIREITKVVAGGTSINAGNVGSAVVGGTGATAAYNTAPISGNGTTATFTTNLDEFAAKTGEAAKTDANKLIKAGGEIAFMFMITLDNNETIIPVQVRARLVQ